MDKKRTIQDSKEDLKKIKHHLKWEDVEVNKVYHIPPIISIERMDVIITSKNDTHVNFKLLDNADKTEKSMHRTSILSRFMIKKMSY